MVAEFPRDARALRTQRHRSGPRPRAFVAVAVPAGRHADRSLLDVASLAQRRRASRAVERLGPPAVDRRPRVGGRAMTFVPRLLRSVPGLALKRLVWSLVRRREFAYSTTTPRGWHVTGHTRDWIQRNLY